MVDGVMVLQRYPCPNPWNPSMLPYMVTWTLLMGLSEEKLSWIMWMDLMRSHVGTKESRSEKPDVTVEPVWKDVIYRWTKRGCDPRSTSGFQKLNKVGTGLPP